MKNHLSLASVIGVAAGVNLTCLISILAGAPITWILGLLFLSNIALVWMVVRILKDPYSTGKTFDEYFYQDRPELRRTGRE